MTEDARPPGRSQDSLTILAVDDDENALFALSSLLEQQGFTVVTAARGDQALRRAREDPPDIALLDVMMPGMTGFELARAFQEDPSLRAVPIVFLTAQSEDEVLPELRAGAVDYIKKPFRRDELLQRIALLMRMRSLYAELERTTAENRELRGRAAERAQFGNIIGKSRPIQEIFVLLEKLRDTTVPVLITGESGTGKELIAQAVHYHSPRREQPFIAQNCSALNENLLESELFGHVRGAFSGATRDKPGLFEVADGGTFFLDELGEMSPALQVKLLRVLQDGSFTPVGSTKMKRVDVRVIAATNRNLEEMIRRGTFREDLYYRLNVVTITLPPLRERSGDVPLLVDFFLGHIARRPGAIQKRFSTEALRCLSAFHWPGNIRQLENEVERATIMSGSQAIIEVADLSPAVRGEPIAIAHAEAPVGGQDPLPKLREATLALERRLIEEALGRTANNKSEAARLLGISRSNLIAKVQEYGGGEEAE